MEHATGRNGGQPRNQQGIGTVGRASDLVPAGRWNGKGKIAHDDVLLWNLARAAMMGRNSSC
ncbi:MAG TPA: hypothetical protein VFZ03_10945, partial [Dongiaceae bacterium]